MHCNKRFCSCEHIEKEVVGDDERCSDTLILAAKIVTWNMVTGNLNWGIKNNEDKPEMSF